MEKLSLNQLRSSFLDFFESKGHFVRKSYSLVPESDHSLLLINAGMAPLKPYYLGTSEPPAKRMTTSQKCIRTGDIENVGVTDRHATFFEMLGNFSFGDYFKREAIQWSWEFSTDVLKLPVGQIWISVYEEDQEAYDIWQKEIGVNPERIVKLGKEDNFWEIGVGPCGPCSELYFDRGEKHGCSNPECKPGCECDRYIEFWNLVFTQFNKDEQGVYTDLPNPNIDTGMGLERIACIMQEVDSIFEIDILKGVLDKIIEIGHVNYKSGDDKADISARIIADHSRAMTFLISDKVVPSNEGRGYVLRRLIRRTLRHGKLLKIRKNFLSPIIDMIIDSYQGAYPELNAQRDYIKKIVSAEEKKFNATLDIGNAKLDSHISRLIKDGEHTLSGKRTFRLYDTFGFPLELTLEILSEHGLTADIEEFNRLMEVQKNNSRKVKFEGRGFDFLNKTLLIDYSKFIKTNGQVGYDKYVEETRIEGIIKDDSEVEKAFEGDTVYLVLKKSPFYPEGGGQVGDEGYIECQHFHSTVLDTKKIQNIVLHKTEINQGEVRVGDEVTASINQIRRNNTARNHTATHLLHQTLKDILGTHIEQSGSLVTPNKLRFDFSHYEPISKENLKEIENTVNKQIELFLPVTAKEMGLKQAVENNVVALFADKYKDKDKVRVIKVGDYSAELCGGTHVNNSGEIGLFKILSESGVASGTRRIEAITGSEIYKLLKKEDFLVNAVCHDLKATPDTILSKLEELIEENKNLKKEIKVLSEKETEKQLGDLVENGKSIKEAIFIANKVENGDSKALENTIDHMTNENPNSVILLANVLDGKIIFLMGVGANLLERGINAGKIIKEVSKTTGGNGGGKANFAKGGGQYVDKIQDAFKVAEHLIQEIM